MTESLILGKLTRVRFHADEKSTSKVGESVEIEKEVVDLILSDDIVRLYLSLIILAATISDCPTAWIRIDY